MSLSAVIGSIVGVFGASKFLMIASEKQFVELSKSKEKQQTTNKKTQEILDLEFRVFGKNFTRSPRQTSRRNLARRSTRIAPESFVESRYFCEEDSIVDIHSPNSRLAFKY